MKITSVSAFEIIDSRGNPTVEVEVRAGNSFGRAAAPSGASTGKFEATELRDGGARYCGKGVLKAVANVNGPITKKLIGMKIDVSEQEKIDEAMLALDGTPNKTKMGANAIVATSMAVLKCAAASEGKPLFAYLGGTRNARKTALPKPMFNILNGGKHAGGNLALQEFMIMPEAKTFSETLRIACEIYHALGSILEKKYGPNARNVGDEGGFAPPVANAEEALDAIMSAIDACGYSKNVKIAIDAAASSFYKEKITAGGEKIGLYIVDRSKPAIDEGALLDFYFALSGKYPITSIEDPFYEEDFDSFSEIVKKLGSRIQIVGDDLVVTNPQRIKKAIEKKAMTALLLKVNQIGTVTEAMEAVKICKKFGLGVVVSHRSGETEDTFIADFAVGTKLDK